MRSSGLSAARSWRSDRVETIGNRQSRAIATCRVRHLVLDSTILLDPSHTSSGARLAANPDLDAE